MKEKIYLIDLDGTMYKGNTIIDGAKAFIDDLIARNRPFLFLTNNARRTGRQNVAHMEKMGFKNICPEHFYTSAMAAASYVAKTSTKRRCFYIGEDGLKEALEKEGFIFVEEHADFVFVGMDDKADYKLYSKALGHLLQGAKLIGTNSDRLLAKDDGFNVGNGCIVAMFEYATEQVSEKIGKPNLPILECALDALKLTKEDVVIVGDNLETDILLGTKNGVETILVTSGVHKEEDVNRLAIKPTRIIHNLKELIP